MAAAAYKVVLTFQGLSNGKKSNYPATATDIADAKFLFPSGQDNLTLPADQAYALVDMIYTAAGTDTSQVYVYAGQKDTGERIYNGANLGTVYDRQVKSSPIGFKAGQNLQFIQKA